MPRIPSILHTNRESREVALKHYTLIDRDAHTLYRGPPYHESMNGPWPHGGSPQASSPDPLGDFTNAFWNTLPFSNPLHVTPAGTTLGNHNNHNNDFQGQVTFAGVVVKVFAIINSHVVNSYMMTSYLMNSMNPHMMNPHMMNSHLSDLGNPGPRCSIRISASIRIF